MNRSTFKLIAVSLVLLSAMAMLLAGLKYLFSPSTRIAGFQIRRVPVQIGDLYGQEIIGIHPSVEGVILVATYPQNRWELSGSRSPYLSYKLICVNFNGMVAQSCELTADKAPFPATDSGLAYIKDIGFIWIGAQKLDKNKYKRYAVLVTSTGQVKALQDIPGYSYPSALYLAEKRLLLVLQAETSEILCYRLGDQGVSNLSSIYFSNAVISSSGGFSKPFIWGKYAGWKHYLGSVLIVDTEQLRIATNEEVVSSFESAVGPKILDEGLVLGVTNRIVLGVRPFGLAGQFPQRETAQAAQAQLGIKLSCGDDTRWYREFNQKSPGMLYTYYRKVGFPTITNLNNTSASNLSNGRAVLYDGVSGELLMIEAK